MPADINKSQNQENSSHHTSQNKTQSPLTHLHSQAKINPLLDSTTLTPTKSPEEIPIHFDTPISPLIPSSTTTHHPPLRTQLLSLTSHLSTLAYYILNTLKSHSPHFIYYSRHHKHHTLLTTWIPLSRFTS